MRIYGGIPVGGNLVGLGLEQNPGFIAGNPFGADFVIPQNQQRPAGGGPQLNPLLQTPTRLYPKDQPGREGAINIQFRQAQLMPGMQMMGNIGGMMASQVPAGFQNKLVY